MTPTYEPGHQLLLPSGRRVAIYKVRHDDLQCLYVTSVDGRLKMGEEVTLTKLFAARFCDLVPGSAG